MTLVREYQPTFVLGDGETKEFSYLFEEVSENFIKVIVKHSDDSTYVPVFSVDLDSHKVVFGESETAPLDTDIICIYRETPDLQDTPFRTLQGYDAKALENILSKIVAMIQELKANGFSTQILQGTPWQLDLLHPADDGASLIVDYNARILKKGLYFQIVSGNLQVSADGNNFIKMPKSADITEFRRLETVLEDLTVQYRLQYKVDGVWYNAESNAEATADEALQVAQDAKDIAQAASDKVDAFDDRLTIAEGDASDAKQDASDAKELAEDTAETVSGFDTRITQAEQNATDAKSIAQTTSGNLTTHTSNTNNPHQVTKAQIGLGNVDNTSDLDKPVSTATQNFVNSSIATSTATFRGTYNSLAELEAVTADENDYGFVVATDSAGNTVYNRYKYTTATTPASWVFEYALNNSSFTAQQWASINSGVTTSDVSKARSAVQPSDLGNGTITITQGGTTKGTFTTNQGNNTTIDIDAGGGGSGLNVGDIFYTMRNDNELNGAVECDGAAYNTTDFTGAESIGNLLAAGKVPYLSLADYATALATDGSVGVFGWDGAGTTAFRVPSLNDIFVETGTAAQLGDFIPAGAPNITGKFTVANSSQKGNIVSTDGCVYADGTTSGAYSSFAGDGNSARGPKVAHIDASRSSSAYGNSDTIQPKSMRYRAMVQLATATTDEAFETCTGVLADVAALKYDYVVDFQAPTASNNYTWYRKYKSGWVEQGGIYTISSVNFADYDLLIPMANTNYTIVGNSADGTTNAYPLNFNQPSFTTTTFSAKTGNASSGKFTWQVSGMSAS